MKRYNPPLTEENIRSYLSTRVLGRTIHTYQKVGSTNEVARQHAQNHAEEGTLVIAEEQIRGKGRRQRVWYSPPGTGLWFSLVLRPSVSAVEAGLLSIIASLSVAEAVAEVTEKPAHLKWPNDVLIHGKKVTGILLESELKGKEIEFLILGIGINVNQQVSDFPDDLRESASSIAIETGDVVDRFALLASTMRYLEVNYFRFCSNDVNELLERWSSHCPHIGQEVSITQEAERAVRGTFLGIDDCGRLSLQTEQDVITLSSGDVAMLR